MEPKRIHRSYFHRSFSLALCFSILFWFRFASRRLCALVRLSNAFGQDTREMTNLTPDLQLVVHPSRPCWPYIFHASRCVVNHHPRTPPVTVAYVHCSLFCPQILSQSSWQNECIASFCIVKLHLARFFVYALQTLGTFTTLQRWILGAKRIRVEW